MPLMHEMMMYIGSRGPNWDNTLGDPSWQHSLASHSPC